MGKIYLQVPSMIAAFYRGKDSLHVLASKDAYAFKMGTAEYQALLLGLRYTSIDEQVKAKCFSQNTWGMMMSGRDPRTGGKLLERNKDEWLSASDISILLGKSYADSQEIFDYLCIEIPKSMIVNGMVRPTNNNYSLDRSLASTLRKMLSIAFYQVLAQWYYKNQEIEEELGIKRSMVDFINRFLFAHGMPVTVNRKEEGTVRKMVMRGLGGNLLLKDEAEKRAVEILQEIYSDERKVKSSDKNEETRGFFKNLNLGNKKD